MRRYLSYNGWSIRGDLLSAENIMEAVGRFYVIVTVLPMTGSHSLLRCSQLSFLTYVNYTISEMSGVSLFNLLSTFAFGVASAITQCSL